MTPNPQIAELENAIDNGDDKRLKALLASGADPNQFVSDGLPLTLCALNHYEDWKACFLFEALVKAGADTGWKDSDGHSLLYLALERDNLRVAEFLLKAGADANEFASDRGADLLDLFGYMGGERCAELLLQHGAKFDRALDTNGRTRLHVSRPPWRTYFANGLGQNLLHVQDSHGNTPLHILATGETRDLWLLLKRTEINPNVQNIEGQTVLHLMIQNGEYAKALDTVYAENAPWKEQPDLTICDTNGHSFADYVSRAATIYLEKTPPDPANANEFPVLLKGPITDQGETELFTLCQLLGLAAGPPKEVVKQPHVPTIDDRKKFLRSPLIKKLAAHGKTAISFSIKTGAEGGFDRISSIDGIPFIYSGCDASCPTCGRGSAFLMQLFKEEHEYFYFPEGTDLFCVFRCWNPECSAQEYGDLEKTIRWVYGQAPRDESKRAEMIEERGYENVYVLDGTKVEDHRDVRDFRTPLNLITDKEQEVFEETYGMMLDDAFNNNFGPIDGVKAGGFAAWVQDSEYPICSCDREKELLLQLSSFYLPKWDHFNFGDAGTIYLFYCATCGEKSIEALYQTH